jgi:uncharacterized protein (TIGR03437 family)
VNFPANLVPLVSVSYVSAANAAGDQLVVGSLNGGLNVLSQIPLPSASNQIFCDARVQLAPQQFFPVVFVPTALERAGNFSAFSGALIDPTTNQPFPGGIIPLNRLGGIYAFRISGLPTPNSARNWSPTGSLGAALANATMVSLPNGKVLVVANDVELYDPASGQFTVLKAPYVVNNGASATLLGDGRVLIQGGNSSPTSAALYDPAKGVFTSIGPTTAGHIGHTATLLSDGRVLMAGGKATTSASRGTNNTEIFDPKSNTFTATGPMNAARYLHAAIRLKDNRVLVAGGYTTAGLLASAEIYDPSTNRFAAVGSMTCGRFSFAPILIPSGKVLMMSACPTSPQVDIFDPATSTFSVDGFLNLDSFSNPAVLLSSGQVLVTGGVLFSGSGALASAELYSPTTHTSTITGNMGVGRALPTAALLPDGRVLVAGGVTPIGTSLSSAEIYTPTVQGLVTSQTGVTFRAAQGAAAAQSRGIAVLSATDTIPYTVSVSTFTGGSWLSFTSFGGSVVPGNSTGLNVTATPGTLAAGDYYGTVTLTPTDGKHPPVSIAVVLSIVPAGSPAAPVVSPNGLVFLGTTGSSPKLQNFSISNLTSSTLTYTATTMQPTAFFNLTPQNGAINAAQTQTFVVTPASSSLAAGVYRGSIVFKFGDGSSQTIDVLLVVSSGSINTPFEREATGCSATKLLPVLTSLGSGFSAPVAWPTAISVQVVDDCGAQVTTGLVSASFTNGDPPLSLVSAGNGMWGATWAPGVNSAGTTVRVDAKSGTLLGSVSVTGQVATNPKVPLVSAGGVLSSGDYIGAPAQGLLASIFGVALADGALQNSSLPLPKQLGTTSVLVSGVEVPMLYVSENQVNVFIPYELAVNSPHQLTLVRGNAASVPVPITILDSQPAILSTAGNGQGQGHIYKIDSAGAQILADASSPATAGDVLVIYCVGLGAVHPPLKSGDPAPFTALEPITGTAVVTFGGVSANTAFAGLTPGYSGLYQINVSVPAGITPGSNVPVTISVNGSASAGAVIMAIK